RVFQNGSGNGDPLPFPSGKLDTSLSHISFIFLRQALNKFITVCQFGRSNHLFIGGVTLSISNIFHQGSVKKNWVLWHQTNIGMETFLSHLLNILFIYQDLTASNVIESK